METDTVVELIFAHHTQSTGKLLDFNCACFFFCRVFIAIKNANSNLTFIHILHAAPILYVLTHIPNTTESPFLPPLDTREMVSMKR
jgi:hypothetical protein